MDFQGSAEESGEGKDLARYLSTMCIIQSMVVSFPPCECLI